MQQNNYFGNEYLRLNAKHAREASRVVDMKVRLNRTAEADRKAERAKPMPKVQIFNYVFRSNMCFVITLYEGANSSFRDYSVGWC